MDKCGRVKTLLFADIGVLTPQYILSHPSGLFFATQFAQVAFVVTEKAAFKDMCMEGFVQKSWAFSDHSPGESDALASTADFALVPSPTTSSTAVLLCSTMCAVNPSRTLPMFSDAALREAVDTITTISGALLEAANYNVEVCSFISSLCVCSYLGSLPGSAICLRWKAFGTTGHGRCC